MPSYTLQNWRVPVTWTAPGQGIGTTRNLKFKATTASQASAMAVTQCVRLEATAPVTYGTPTLDPDQSW